MVLLTPPSRRRARLANVGLKTSYLRIKALPVNTAVLDFIRKYDRVYVVENNYDGQMRKILQTEVPDRANQLIQLAHCDGLPLSSEFVAQGIVNLEKEQ